MIAAAAGPFRATLRFALHAPASASKTQQTIE